VLYQFWCDNAVTKRSPCILLFYPLWGHMLPNTYLSLFYYCLAFEAAPLCPSIECDQDPNIVGAMLHIKRKLHHQPFVAASLCYQLLQISFSTPIPVPDNLWPLQNRQLTATGSGGTTLKLKLQSFHHFVINIWTRSHHWSLVVCLISVWTLLFTLYLLLFDKTHIVLSTILCIFPN